MEEIFTQPTPKIRDINPDLMGFSGILRATSRASRNYSTVGFAGKDEMASTISSTTRITLALPGDKSKCLSPPPGQMAQLSTRKEITNVTGVAGVN